MNKWYNRMFNNWMNVSESNARRKKKKKKKDYKKMAADATLPVQPR